MRQETNQNVYATYGNHPALYPCRKDIPEEMDYKRFRNIEKAMFSLYDRGYVMYHDWTGLQSVQNVIDRQIGINSVNEAVAYINGSYNIHTGQYGIGIVFVYAGETVEFAEGDDEVYEMNHITGELKAALKAVTYAVLLGLRKITIVYGYVGVEKLANGEWYGNQPFTEEYRMEMYEASTLLDICFVKAGKGSGLLGYEKADILAKKGCGVIK